MITVSSPVLTIIPCYNEAENLPQFLQKLAALIQDHPEISPLFINDQSRDDSARIIDRAGYPYISHPVNLGYNYAIQTGLKYGIRQGFERFILLDGDGQHPPEEIPKLLSALDDSTDLVIGSRFSSAYLPSYPIPFTRRLAMIFFSLLTSFLTGQMIHDTSSGFQAFRLKAAKTMVPIYETEFPDSEAILLLRRLKIRIREIPVTMRIRVSGSSMIKIYYPLRALSGIVFALFNISAIKKRIVP